MHNERGLPSAMCESLKRIRKLQNLTQDQIARKTKLSVCFINQIEKGKKTPSLKTLLEKIGPAYNIENIFSLLDEKKIEKKPLVVITEKKGLKILLLGKSKKLVYEILSNEMVSNEHMFVSFVTIKKGGSFGQKSFHPGEEIIYLIKGSILLSVGKDEFILKARNERGDLAHFKSTEPHSIINNGKTLAKMLLVRFPGHHYKV